MAPKPKTPGFWRLPALSAGALALGTFLYGHPVGPDVPTPTLHYFGAFFLFGFWVTGVLSWGRLLARWHHAEEALGWAAPLVLGTAGAAFTGMTVGEGGLIGATHKTVLEALTLLGPVMLALDPARAKPASGRVPVMPGLDHFFLALIGFLVASTFLGASVPLKGTDEYRYHLMGPWLWFDKGVIYRATEATLIWQCSYWEYLYLWGNSLLGGAQGTGQIAAQLFARWTHALLGFGGAALALEALFRPMARNRAWAWLAVLAALAIPQLDWTAWQGKSDWGVILWSVGGVALLWAPKPSPKRLLMAGALLGMSIAAKYNCGFIVLPAVALWAVRERRRARLAVPMVAALVGTLGFILARNWEAVGNPFFPALDSIFHSPWIGPKLEWQQRVFYEVQGISLDWGLWLSKLRSLLSNSPESVVFLAFPAFLPVLKKNRELRQLWAATAIGFAIYLLKVGPGLEDTLRLAGPVLPLAAGVAVLALGELFGSTRALRGRSSQVAAVIVAVVALVPALSGSNIPWRAWVDLAKLPSAPNIVRNLHTAGDSKDWLRAHAQNGEVIFSTGDDQLYYVAHLRPIMIPNQPELGWETIEMWDPRELLWALRERDGKYLLNSLHWSGKPWSTVSWIFSRLIVAHPEAVAFAGRASSVTDLERLEAEELQACAWHRDAEWRRYLGAAPADFEERRESGLAHFF